MSCFGDSRISFEYHTAPGEIDNILKFLAKLVTLGNYKLQVRPAEASCFLDQAPIPAVTAIHNPELLHLGSSKEGFREIFATWASLRLLISWGRSSRPSFLGQLARWG